MIDFDGLWRLLCDSVLGLAFDLPQQGLFESCSADWAESWRAISCCVVPGPSRSTYSDD